MRKTIQIGLVGYKFMGKAHSNGFSQLRMLFDTDADIVMKAICGRDEAGVAAARDAYGWQDYETDYRKLVARADIDAIDVTSPSDSHKDIVLAAVENGKHVFCEKPLALNLADARQMLQAAQQAGVRHQVGFNYRTAPAIAYARQLIESGKLGRIFHFRGQYLQDWIISPDFPMVWRLNKDICGSGSLGDLGAHVIDLAHYLVGGIKTVTGMNKTFITKRKAAASMSGISGTAAADAPLCDVTVDDATLFCCEFDCGAMGVFEATRFAQGNRNAMSFEINAERGSIRFELERLNELQFYDAAAQPGRQGFTLIQCTEGEHPYVENWWPAGHVLGYENTFANQFYGFVQAIAQRRDASPGFDAGVAVAQVMDAVDLSIQQRAWVDVAEL